jgi:hypothetical protein
VSRSCWPRCRRSNRSYRNIDPAFSSISSKAMARDVSHRFQSSTDFHSRHRRMGLAWRGRQRFPRPSDAATGGFVPRRRLRSAPRRWGEDRGHPGRPPSPTRPCAREEGRRWRSWRESRAAARRRCLRPFTCSASLPRPWRTRAPRPRPRRSRPSRLPPRPPEPAKPPEAVAPVAATEPRGDGER